MRLARRLSICRQAVRVEAAGERSKGMKMMNTTEQATALNSMRATSALFYANAVRIGNHPFIEFCGLMNEYIKACEIAHKSGIDFSECSAHSGQPLPMKSYMIDYVNEKLNCIFTGRVELDA